MSMVGKQLKYPDAGWKSYDHTDDRINYQGNWFVATDGGSAYKYYFGSGGKISFKFYGEKNKDNWNL